MLYCKVLSWLGISSYTLITMECIIIYVPYKHRFSRTNSSLCAPMNRMVKKSNSV